MRIRTLASALAAVLAVMAYNVALAAAETKGSTAGKPPATAAPVKPADQAPKTAAEQTKPTAQAPASEEAKAPPFDQAATLEKFWKAPNDAVVATVNGEKITKGELMKALWDWNAPAVLDELITDRIILQAAQSAGVKVSPKEVEDKIRQQLGMMMGPGESNWRDTLRRINMTEARARERVGVSLAAEQAVKKDITVTEAQFAEWVKARHILVRINQQEADKNKADADAKAKAEKVLADLKAGRRFEDLAREVSDDTSNKEQGGDLGWFKRGRMVKEFDDAVFGTGDKPGMKAGEISAAPVKTMFGYHIIKCEKLGKEASGEDKEALRNKILEDTVPMQMRDWFNKVRSSAKTENLLNPPLPPMAGMGPPAPPKPAEAKKPEPTKPAEAKKPESAKPATTAPAAKDASKSAAPAPSGLAEKK